MFASLTAVAQPDSLPYATFPPAPDHYSASTVVSRLLDGWASVIIGLQKGYAP
jgi:hypothetical protein